MLDQGVERIKPVLAVNVVVMILFSMAVCFTSDITTSKVSIYSLTYFLSLIDYFLPEFGGGVWDWGIRIGLLSELGYEFYVSLNVVESELGCAAWLQELKCGG